MSAIEQYRHDLRFDCASCWAAPCAEHGPVPTKVVTKTLVANYDHLGRRYEEARQNLAVVLDMPLDTEFMLLVAEVQWRLRPAPRKRMTVEEIVVDAENRGLL
jgi:hypothetical protein